MKFLDGIFDNRNIMPLNIYYNNGTYNENDDVVDIIYKDMDTGKKYVQSITHPEYEVWVTKPEYRNYNYIKNFMEKDKCYPIKVHYKTRYIELAKHLKVPYDQVKFSPYVFGLDMHIEHFYLMHFILEYGNDRPKKLSLGYLDIENDIIRVDGFPEPGEAPINAVTYIDESTKEVYTLCLTKDNLPHLEPSHKLYAKVEEMRESFNKQVEDFKNNISSFIEECHQMFDDFYGVFNYNIFMIDDEIDLIKILFEIIKKSDNDYIGIWNMPYDMQNLIERPKVLGYDPNSIIVDERFGERDVSFYEDTNALIHKRKHLCRTYTMPTFVDEMVNYTGIRSAKGKLPSAKLNYIAQLELRDTKLDYSEETDIKHFPYKNYRKFILYNIKDVLLLYGLNRKTKDFNTFYNTIYADMVLPHEVFTSTIIILNALRLFVYDYKGGYVIGSNKGKLFKNIRDNEDKLLKIIGQMSNNENNEYEEYDENLYFSLLEDNGEEEEDEESDAKKKKKDKFKGAFVMNPSHMSSTGYKLMGKESKFIHEKVIDEDIVSEYPTGINIMNSSNDTLVGKVYLDNPEEVPIPLYDEFNFLGTEKAEYKEDPSSFLTECYSENDILNFGHIFLRLPEPNDVLSVIGDNINELIKK